MATNPVVAFVQRVRRSTLLRESEEQTDGQLLEEFVRRRDSLALETLVRRHAPMVWGVCRRTLSGHHDAEDAFQSTFLVLVRKAASIRSRELLANWLYRVALKTALKARKMAAQREKPVGVLPEPEPVEPRDGEFGPELRALLDEELSRLPQKYRIVLVLCGLEGRSRPQVARQLRLPEGTVGSRLARARALLAGRLARRGVSVPATALAAVLPNQAASGSVPAALLSNTVQATTPLAAGGTAAAGATSAQVSTLTEGALRTMALTKCKSACVLLFMAALALGGGAAAYHILAGRPDNPKPPPGERPGGGATADLKKYRSAADAKERAAGIIFAWFAARPSNPTVHIDPRPLEATLDQDQGQWTVTGVLYLRVEDGPAYEVPWKLVLDCRRWEAVSGGWPGQDSIDDALFNPARYGWRPVGKKDDKGGGR
jgi:RNA polymerase sigma factor (sigma-70 family)